MKFIFIVSFILILPQSAVMAETFTYDKNSKNCYYTYRSKCTSAKMNSCFNHCKGLGTSALLSCNKSCTKQGCFYAISCGSSAAIACMRYPTKIRKDSRCK